MKALRSLGLALLLLLGACGGGGEPEEAADGGSGTTQSSEAAGTTDSSEATGESGENEHGEGGHGHEAAKFPASEATQVVKITMRDYAYIDMPASVTGPRLRIEGKNNGPTEHEMVIFDADGNEIGGVEPFKSGESKALSLELTAGTYEMRCLIPVSSSETHADRGMRVTFAVM